MNNCSFVGRLTATPTLKTTQNGKSVCSFSLAVDKRFSNSNGEKEVSYIDFVAWNHNAEFLCKWFDKGVRVAVTGELVPRIYEDKDGKKIKVAEIIANTIEFADGKREANAATVTTYQNPNPMPDTSATQAQSQSNNVFANDGFVPIDTGDDLPF